MSEERSLRQKSMADFDPEDLGRRLYLESRSGEVIDGKTFAQRFIAAFIKAMEEDKDAQR